MEYRLIDQPRLADRIYDELNDSVTVQPKNPHYWVNTIPCHMDLNPVFIQTNEYRRKQYKKRKLKLNE